MVLGKRKLKACDLALIIAAVQVYCQGTSIVLDMVDAASQSRDIGVVGVGHTDIHPFQRTVLVIVQHLPVDVISHLQRGILLHIHSDPEVLDLISGAVCPHRHCEGRQKAHAEYHENSCQVQDETPARYIFSQ